MAVADHPATLVLGEEAAAIREAFDRATPAHTYLVSHRQELRERFLDQWVVVSGEGVVFTRPRLEDVLPEIQRRGLVSQELAIEFMDSQDRLHGL